MAEPPGGQGFPYADAWRPGLSADAIAALERRANVVLSPELRIWWSWRDGIERVQGPSGSGYAVLPTGVRPWNLERALQHSQAAREERVAVGLNGWPEDPRWLQIADMGNGDMLMADLQTNDGASRVRLAWLKDKNDLPLDAVPSLGTLVTWWIEALQTGAHYWDGDAGVWRVGQGLPRERTRTALY